MGRLSQRSMPKKEHQNWLIDWFRSSSMQTWWHLFGSLRYKGSDLSCQSDHHNIWSFPSTCWSRTLKSIQRGAEAADQLKLDWQLVYRKASWDAVKQWKAIKSARLGHDEFSASQLLNAARPHLLVDLSLASAAHLRFRLAMSNHPSHLQTDNHHWGAPVWLMALWRHWKLGDGDASVFDVPSRRVCGKKNSQHCCLFAV